MARNTATIGNHLAAIKQTYAHATNRIDLGSGAKAHIVRVLATGAAQRLWLIPSANVMSEAEVTAAMALPARRTAFFVGDVTVGIPQWQEAIFDSPMRYLHFAAETSDVKADVQSENA